MYAFLTSSLSNQSIRLTPSTLSTVYRSRSSETSHTILDKAGSAATYVSESIQGAFSGASKDVNKEVAKGNTDAPISDRASAAFNTVGDKIDQVSHDTKAANAKAAAK